ncbi:integrase arm-type DNA-binding domain-containing protein [Bradyrhizobium sp. AUGA SZCCT0042]|uniref:tyrosine-type recombinase/integrase n=1 Tax=Bradyrhizobium sp. AUGA SZCCT0042 TaxID=2807651 RepID=UPI001BA6C2E1|nr:integrase arm-type DNA-binding domain-containing protein [Bradyrhizobium sp. AUGA SZCCT0042]MBR1298532.1 integrase arm-type DNA-binding domain-containing protein [Bradyrhizobium sp. AUGA SZCCT0042]
MLNDTTCRNLKPQAKPYKKSDGGGLQLLVTTGGSKLWRLAYRFGGKQKEVAFGAYPATTLADARAKRDVAKAQLAKGIDPGVAKQEAKREEAAARTFGAWADEWLEKQRTVHDEKTMAGKDRFVGYLKKEFGQRLIPAIARGDVLLYLRTFEKTGKLETRDRVRSTGAQICIYADVHGSDYNPFRPFAKEQLVANESEPRPALVGDDEVQTLFQDIAAPFERARYNDLVGFALRFLSLTVVRPGEIATAEWCDFDFIKARWTISPEKMKMDKEHVVPLSQQALALLAQVRRHTGNRTFVFSCSQDKPISDNTLCKRLRDLGYDTSVEHCAHGFRTTFSTLCNGETNCDESKMWDGDLIELQLAHLDETSVKAIYNRTGPLSLIGARAKLLQHWADRIDSMVGNNVVPLRKQVQESVSA